MIKNRDEILKFDDEELLRVCERDFFQASGPGGQKRNKCASAVRLRLKDADITVIDCEERSRHLNIRNALRKMRLAVALHYRETPPLAPSRFDTSLESIDYPLWLARMVDVIAHYGDLKKSAEFLNVSRSALEKKLRRDRALWQYISKIIQSKLEK